MLLFILYEFESNVVAVLYFLFGIFKKEEMEGLPGYLSLHSNYNTNLTLKWTPNQLMNGSTGDESINFRTKK